MADEDAVRSGDPLADIGELNVLEAESGGADVDTAARIPEFGVELTADFAAEPEHQTPVQEIEVPELEVLEASGAEVTEDGTIIAESITVAYDEASGTAVIDEVLGVLTPDGTEIYDETVSVVDADGEFRVVAEDVVVN